MAREFTRQALERNSTHSTAYAARARAYGERHLTPATPETATPATKHTKVRQRERTCTERTLGNRSINATLALLAEVLELAGEYEHIQFNPARGRRRRLKAAQPKRTWLEPEQSTSPTAASRSWTPRPKPASAAKSTSGPSNPNQTRQASDYMFTAVNGKADTRSNLHKRLNRAVTRANKQLAERKDVPPDPHRTLATLAATHIRLAALPTRREPRLRHAPDGDEIHRLRARPSHLRQGHGRATPPRLRRPPRSRARRGAVGRGRARASFRQGHRIRRQPTIFAHDRPRPKSVPQTGLRPRSLRNIARARSEA
jgi:hypothetical protein